jgi:transposase InsO family protein
VSHATAARGSTVTPRPPVRLEVEWSADLRCCVAHAFDAEHRCVLTLRFDNGEPVLDVCARLRMEAAARAELASLWSTR